MQKGFVIFLIIVVLILGLCLIQNKALDKRKDDLSSSSLEAKLGPFEARQTLNFTKDTEALPEGLIKSTSKVTSPVNADITVDTVSRDNVAVTGVWQEGKKTVLVLEPTVDEL